MATIDTSNASRELDAWIVENVLGWKRHNKCEECMVSPVHVYHHGVHIYDDWQAKECHPRMTTPTGERYWLCPCQNRKGTIEILAFSASIVSSMSLVDKLIADGADWEFGYTCPNDITPKEKWGWYAELILPDTYTGSFPLAYADTLPLAICQALYKWKEGEK